MSWLNYLNKIYPPQKKPKEEVKHLKAVHNARYLYKAMLRSDYVIKIFNLADGDLRKKPANMALQ